MKTNNLSLVTVSATGTKYKCVDILYESIVNLHFLV